MSPVEDQQSEDCKTAIDCHLQAVNVDTACNPISLPTAGISMLKRYICGDFNCAKQVRQLLQECKQFPAKSVIADTIGDYQEKYCPLEYKTTDLINDHANCHMGIMDQNSTFCLNVKQCNIDLSEIRYHCEIGDNIHSSMFTVQMVEKAVCGTGCTDRINRLVSDCANYSAVQDSLKPILMYQKSFQCLSQQSTLYSDVTVNFQTPSAGGLLSATFAVSCLAAVAFFLRTWSRSRCEGRREESIREIEEGNFLRVAEAREGCEEDEQPLLQKA